MKKLFKRIKWVDVRILLVCAIAFVVYSFSNKKSEDKEISGIEVFFKGEDYHFVTGADIRSMVEKSLPNTSRVNRSIVDLKKVEDEVLSNELIKNAEVYLSIDGKLYVDVWQKEAVGRYFENGKSYYIDNTGRSMPISRNFSQRVPMIDGRITENNRGDLLKILKLINESEFLKQDLTGIIIRGDETLMLKSRTNDYSISFGTFDEMEKKLNNYTAFVKYCTEGKLDTKQYKSINLRFTQQVVCSK